MIRVMMKEAGFITITYTQLAIKWAKGDTLATFGLFSKSIVHHGASKGIYCSSSFIWGCM